ncbi:MAG: hypothetical protein AB4063_19115 [Crocosphaera sp.]
MPTYLEVDELVADFSYTFSRKRLNLPQYSGKLDKTQSNLLGAVTIGNIWQFAQLYPEKKHIEQGLETYRVPEDLDPLTRILVQALKS